MRILRPLSQYMGHPLAMTLLVVALAAADRADAQCVAPSNVSVVQLDPNDCRAGVEVRWTRNSDCRHRVKANGPPNPSVSANPGPVTFFRHNPGEITTTYIVSAGDLPDVKEAAPVTFTCKPPPPTWTGTLVAPTKTGVCGVAYNGMASGQKLLTNQYILSPNKAFQLKLGSDHRLALNSATGTLWTSPNSASASAATAVMQADGTFAIVRGGPVWSSLITSAGAFVAVQDDGGVVVYKANSCTAVTRIR